jgi:hypothetical protein
VGKDSKFTEINDFMFLWMVKAIGSNIPLSSPLLQAKAREFANKLGVKEFKASNGWLQKFEQRRNIKCYTICGEGAIVSEETVTQFRENVEEIMLGFEPKNVFNADELGLFYKLLPKRTLAKSSKE